MKKDIAPISNGTVIDHIPKAGAIDVMRILKIKSAIQNHNITVRIAMNVNSVKSGRKDLVMIEGRELNKKQTDMISLVAPNATINIIRNSEVSSKRRVSVPKEIDGLIKCQNPNCISNTEREHLIPKFIIASTDPLKARCFYCEKIIESSDIPKAIII